MGNCLPVPRVYYDASEEAAVTAGAKRGRKRKTSGRNGRAARHVVPVDMPEDSGDGDEEGIKAALPAGCHVEHIRGDDDGGVRVKIVMKRKEVEELVARLEQRDAAERKTRMEELNTELGGGGVATTMMSPCRDSWRPRLASIPEN